ncbi:hypothetical protein [uncultured Phenylobacterium sp.]|uniref:hypothetical protein n=1 Tax=uncultured Phenylobacterium sp. TaxID=349273 RepID=UPI0025FDC24A|nr:hypothetical protein [uncultured Phenylobacterium sp.]
MKSSFAAQTGLKLARSPSAQQLAMRRRLVALGAVIGLAMVSGLLGVLTVPPGPIEPPARAGPFSYFPS